ncbi:MAG: major capsid protein [Sphaerochaetaceae bacterium]|nr:major capsid protein [Sphaerochaetaceae bacterium]
MTILEIMKLWTLTTMLKAINSIKLVSMYTYNKYFEGKEEPVYGNLAKLKIKKGAGLVLESIAPGADRLVDDLDDIYEITIEVPRFGKDAELLAHEINQFETLEGKNKAAAVSTWFKNKMKEHVADYSTTIEFMAAGALFGKVVDGKGKVLFEFKTTDEPVEFKDKDIDTVLEEIDDKLVEQLGMEVPYEVLCSSVFMKRLRAKAKAENLFEAKTAKDVDEDGKRVLLVHGKKFIPYRNSYKNTQGDTKKFIEDGKAVVIPNSEEVYKVVVARADHTEAIKTVPTKFFASAPEKLPKGKGWGFSTESKVLPYCVKPEALIKLNFAA